MYQEEKIQTEYEEINLMDYFKVILKRKRLIFAVFLIVMVIVGVYSFFVAQKVYKINTTLETPAEEAIGLLEKVKNDIYGIYIREKLAISEREFPEIKTENPLNTNLVILKIESGLTQEAKNILEEMNNFILAESQEKVKLEKKSMENQIKGIEEEAESKKESTQNEIIMTESNIKLMGKDIEIARNDIGRVGDNVKRIENKIDYTKEEKENLEAKIEALEKVLIYQQTPGTQFALFDVKEKLANKKQEIEDLYLEINSLRRDKEDLEAEIKSLETNIENLRIKISSLENSLERYIEDAKTRIDFLKASLNEIKPIKVVKNPTISENPIKPKPVLNIVIAGALGIFLGVFWALGKEWWDKNK